MIRRKHLALATERSYCAWLRRYCDDLKGLPAHLSSEQKLGRFLNALGQENAAASTQNQASNAIIFFYKEALGVELKNVQDFRARKASKAQPDFVRHCTDRGLATESALHYLRTRLPQQYAVAEVACKCNRPFPLC